MPKLSSENKYKCKLLPYEREDVLTIQDVQKHIGWQVTAFNLPEAWHYTQGEGVKVAVIDTGVDLNHSDLIENLLPGKNFVDPSKPPIDDSSHGTHCIGIICGKNTEFNMVGIAPKCKVIPVKALDSEGKGDLQVVAAAIRWAADQDVDFIAMSLGSPNPIQQVRRAIQYAASKGAVTFCAAGNAGRTREIFYPAAYPEVIGIGAIDEKFDRANFSCTGPDLDFLAPGVSILSTVPDNWYAVMSGTSMSNPFVVGIAALLLSYKRIHNLPISLETSEDYMNILKQYTIPTRNPEYAGQRFFEGFGIIDPRKMEEWVSQNQ